jgi:hypothetical protein
MKKKVITGLLCLLPAFVFPVSSGTKCKIDEWMGRFRYYERFSPAVFTQKNLSFFWQRSFELGYIGAEFKRLYMTFENVRKCSPDSYSVRGYSVAGANVCSFTGTIYNIRYYADRHAANYTENYGCCNTYGYLTADFIIEENPREKASGVFEGALYTHWMLSPGGTVSLVDECLGTHEERNNQFFGEWRSYKTGAVRPVAWGDLRLPMSEELDCGCCEFWPDRRYVNNGWEDYY